MERSGVIDFHSHVLPGIDDGSRDATLHNLKKVYARKDCRVKIVF